MKKKIISWLVNFFIDFTLLYSPALVQVFDLCLLTRANLQSVRIYENN